MSAFKRYLWVLTAFALIAGTTYFLLTREWTGTVLLLALATMPLIVGIWLARHAAPLSSDDPDTTATDHEGEHIGSFPASTVWPIFFVLGMILTGASLIYGLILIPGGALILGVSIVGLMKESQS